MTHHAEEHTTLPRLASAVTDAVGSSPRAAPLSRSYFRLEVEQNHMVVPL
jgi:hypothetical protein